MANAAACRRKRKRVNGTVGSLVDSGFLPVRFRSLASEILETKWRELRIRKSLGIFDMRL